MVDEPEHRNPITYADAGVSIERGASFVDAIAPMARSTHRPGVMGALGGFGGLFDLKATGLSDPILVAANDGVGTKLRLAIDLERHDTVGIDLVAMCVNDLVVQGAEPLFFLDYLGAAGLEALRDEAILAGVAEGCRQAGCALLGGETAELPGMYAPGDYDLAGFALGAAERDGLLPREVTIGDAILALPSSGLHSNGFSLVRRIVERSGSSLRDRAPFATTALGEALLEPTRIYVRPILDAIRQGASIRALAHITGGGLPENVPRVLPQGTCARIDLDTIDLPPVFRWLREAGPVEATEMLRTFNCGVGMAVVCPSDEADAVIEAFGDLRAWRIGEIVARTDGPFETTGTLR